MLLFSCGMGAQLVTPECRICPSLSCYLLMSPDPHCLNSRKSLLTPLYCIRKPFILKFPHFFSDPVMLICKGCPLWRVGEAGG